MAPEHIAVICTHGHIVARTLRDPDEIGAFCATCGAETTDVCPKCSAPIPGCDPLYLGSWPPPAFCLSCGAAYPWTEGQLAAARESVDLLEGLTDDERLELRLSLDALIVDVPRTQVAALRARILIAKARGPAVATFAESIRSFGVAAALKVLFP
jgi:hypothetical protein